MNTGTKMRKELPKPKIKCPGCGAPLVRLDAERHICTNNVVCGSWIKDSDIKRDSASSFI